MNCEKCGKELGFFESLGSTLCFSCREEEREKQVKIREIKEKLIEYGIFESRTSEGKEGGFIDIHPYVDFSSDGFSELFPKNARGHVFTIKIKYSSVVDKIIKNESSAKKIAEELYKKAYKEYEKKKIIERQKRLRLKQEAEKEYFGKPKNDRRSISEDEKESILAQFNHECVICGAKEGLHIHHKDKNSSNNQISNLLVLCGVCHKKVHMKVR